MEPTGEKSNSREEEFRTLCLELLGDAEFEPDPETGEQSRERHFDSGDPVEGYLTSPGFSVVETISADGHNMGVYYHQMVPYPDAEGRSGHDAYFEIEHFIILDDKNQLSEEYDNSDGRDSTKLDFLEHLKILKAEQEDYAQVVEGRRLHARQAEGPAFGELEVLTPEAASEIFEHTDLEALARRTDNPNLDYSLYDYIKTFGLEPVARQKLTDTLTANYSKVFQSDGRLAVIAYMQQGETVMPRYFYLSNTQAVWRYLPYTWHGAYGSEMKNNGHGVNLPLPMQVALSKLAAGGTRDNVEDHLYKAMAPQGLLANFDYQFQDEMRLIDDRHFTNWQYRPEELNIRPEVQDSKPDFELTLAEWEIDSPLYGKVSYRAIPSQNGRLCYIFARDEKGRAWIAGIDDSTADIRPNGLRQTVVISRALAQPAIDTLRGSKEPLATRSLGNGYFDMYERFVSKLPLIRDFLELPDPKSIEELAAEFKEVDIMVDEKAAAAIERYIKDFIQSYTADELISSLGDNHSQRNPKETGYEVEGNLVDSTSGGSLVDMFVGLPNGVVSVEEAMIGPINVARGRAAITFLGPAELGRQGVYGYVHTSGLDEVRQRAIVGVFDEEESSRVQAALRARLVKMLQSS